jgi:predicted nuclease with RNAse H fold
VKAAKESMEAVQFFGSRGVPVINTSPRGKKSRTQNSATYPSLHIQSMATQKPLPSATKTIGSKKVSAWLKMFTTDIF